MTDIIFLKGFNRKYYSIFQKINKNLIIFPLDYESLLTLEQLKINFEYIDEYLNDNERKQIFIFCRTIWSKFVSDDHSLNLSGINIFKCIDRNEIHEYMMEIYSNLFIMKKIIEKFNPNIVYGPSEIIRLLQNQDFKLNCISLYEDSEYELSFDYINFRKKILFFDLNLRFSRNLFKLIKNFSEKFFSFILNNQKLNKSSRITLLFEFDPCQYHELIKKISESGITPFLINFRKPSITSYKSLKIIKNCNAIIINYKIDKKTSNELTNFKNNFKLEINKIDFSIFNYNCNLENTMKKKIISIINSRIDEYFLMINYFKYLKNSFKIESAFSLNLSGESEKIFSNLKKSIPMTLLQHGFSNYGEFNSYTDTLDDYDLINEKIAVWGKSVQNYLTNFKNIPKEKIITFGSIKHKMLLDLLSHKKLNNKSKFILITLRPIIKHVEGNKLKLFSIYSNLLIELINYLNDIDEFEILIKLHPQQNPHNDILKTQIKKYFPKVQIFQMEPVENLIQKSYLIVNISPDNFDMSTVILDSMVLGIPVLNIKLQKNSWTFDLEKSGALLSVNFDDYQNKLHQLIFDDSFYRIQKENISKFLSKYLVSDLSYTEILEKT